MNSKIDLMKYVADKEDIDPESFIIADYVYSGRENWIKLGAKIAAEQSTGTWVEVAGERDIVERHGARVFDGDFNGRQGKLRIAFPVENLNPRDGIPMLLSTIAGNLFGMKVVEKIRLEDVHIPNSYMKAFNGPKYGIEGLRKIIGSEGRPHIGTIIKPDVGLPPDVFAEYCYEAAIGGVDFIKDDELLGDPAHSPRFERLNRVMEALDRVREETGRTVLYALNITTRMSKIVEVAEKAKEEGANCVMINAVTLGLSSIRAVSETVDIPIHVHRDMHAAFTRDKSHGISMLVLAKLIRLVGGDQLHTGAVGKMQGNVKEIQEINHFLRSEWYGLKTTMPVASGGIHPSLVPANLDAFGIDIVLQAGGGIMAHPMGIRAGARAMVQAMEASLKGISLREYAKNHEELKVALNTFG
jgi:ribulose-bisphosphate carboxylase large chain